MADYTTCKNCGYQLKSYYKHCPECGQKVNDNLTLGVLFSNTISNYFSVDARFFRSFIPLMFRPGFLAKKFVEGKRLMYLHPAQFYLFISVVFFFVFSFSVRKSEQKLDAALQADFEKQNGIAVIDKDTLDIMKPLDSAEVENLLKPLKENQGVIGLDEKEMKALDSVLKTSPMQTSGLDSFGFSKKKIDSLIEAKAPEKLIYKEMGMKEDAGKMTRKLYTQILKLYKNRGGGILGAFYDTIPVAMFILLPIFAFILKLFFFRRGRYAHHLVFSFYFFSFLFLVFSLIRLVNYVWDIPDWIDTLLVFSTFFYLFFAVKQFYGQGYFISFIKSNLVTFTYFIFVIPIAIVLIAATAFMFY